MCSIRPVCHVSNYLIKKSAICTIIAKRVAFNGGIVRQMCRSLLRNQRLHFFLCFPANGIQAKWGHKNINNCASLMTRFSPSTNVFVLESCGRFSPRRHSSWHWLKKITFREELLRNSLWLYIFVSYNIPGTGKGIILDANHPSLESSIFKKIISTRRITTFGKPLMRLKPNWIVFH